MLAVIGVLYSFGTILSQRRALQTAADAASLGATWQVLSELASDNRSDANVLFVVDRYATLNGASTGAVSAIYVDATGNQLGSVGAGGQFAPNVRGVRLNVYGQVPTILPFFTGMAQVLVQDSASATARPTAPPASAALVIPVAINVSSVVMHGSFDLFGANSHTLDLSSAGAPTFGPASTNEQYWSDGQHSGGWLLSQPSTVNLADAAYHDSIAAGLLDNVRRQALAPDSNGQTYGLVTAPVYDSVTSTSVHVVGFVQLKVFASQVNSASASVLFVPYPAGAFGTPQLPSPDLGGALVGLVS